CSYLSAKIVRVCSYASDASPWNRSTPFPIVFRCTRFISPTHKEGSCPCLCPADHSAGILHSRLSLTAARGCIPLVGWARSFGLFPLKTVRAGLSACGSRHSSCIHSKIPTFLGS
ncbi:unnamed protein product, partial [Musa hybrid cultivar]